MSAGPRFHPSARMNRVPKFDSNFRNQRLLGVCNPHSHGLRIAWPAGFPNRHGHVALTKGWSANMDIDPVVAFAEELRATEQALRTAVRRYELDHVRGEWRNSEHPARRAQKPLSRHRRDRPTSAMGAGEMVRLAAQRLPFSLSRYCTHFHEVADRPWSRAARTCRSGLASGDAGGPERRRLWRTGIEGRTFAGPGHRRRRASRGGFPLLGEPPPDSIGPPAPLRSWRGEASLPPHKGASHAENRHCRCPGFDSGRWQRCRRDTKILDHHVANMRRAIWKACCPTMRPMPWW